MIAELSFALILMMIGSYRLTFEFSSPGFGLAGRVGAICLQLFDRDLRPLDDSPSFASLPIDEWLGECVKNLWKSLWKSL